MDIYFIAKKRRERASLELIENLKKDHDKVFLNNKFLKCVTFIIINCKKIDSIVLNSDREIDKGFFILGLSYYLNIPVTIIAPDLMSNHELATSIRKPADNLALKLSQFNYKGNILQTEKGNYLFYNSLMLVFFKPFLGFISDNPWIEGAGYSEKFIHRFPIDSKSREVLRGYGKKIDQVKDISFLFLDKFKNKKEKRTTESILALPQFYEQGLLDYEEANLLNCKIIEKIFERDGNLSISLHPRMKESDYKWIQSKFEDVKILSTPIFKSLVHYKIFYCVNSSTSIYANYLGIETYMIKVPFLNYSYFEELEFEHIRIIDLDSL